MSDHMPPVSIRDDLLAAINSLVGLRCWYINSYVFGSSISLSLGEKLRRRESLQLEGHDAEFRDHEGEATLYVWCTWRLDGTEAPLTSSDDQAETGSRALNQLTGTSISAVTVSPMWDLKLHFSNQCELHVFCDHVPGQPSWDGNWDLQFADRAYTVGPGIRVIRDSR